MASPRTAAWSLLDELVWNSCPRAPGASAASPALLYLYYRSRPFKHKYAKHIRKYVKLRKIYENVFTVEPPGGKRSK